MGHVRAWKIGATGVAVVSLAAASLTLAGGSAASAASPPSGGGVPKHGAPGVGPGGTGAPGQQNTATLTFTFSTSIPSTTIDVSSYDFSQSNLNMGSQSSGAGGGKVTFNPLVVTTPLRAQTTALIGELTGHFQTAELVVRGDGGTTVLDATFGLVALKQLEISSASGGTATLTLEYGALKLADPGASNVTP